jgi:hypothetical protein
VKLPTPLAVLVLPSPQSMVMPRAAAVLAGVEVVGEVEGRRRRPWRWGAAGGAVGATLSMVTAWVPRVKLPSSSVVLTVMVALPGPSA